MPKRVTADPEFNNAIDDVPLPGEPIKIGPIENALRVLLGNTLKNREDVLGLLQGVKRFRSVRSLNELSELGGETGDIVQVYGNGVYFFDSGWGGGVNPPWIVQGSGGVWRHIVHLLAGQPGGLATLNGSGELAQPLPDGSVVTSKIADKAITTSKLADDVFGQLQIPDGSITESKLADGAVTEAKIANGAVTEEKLHLQDSRGNYRIGPLAFKSDVWNIYLVGTPENPADGEPIHIHSVFVGTGMEPYMTLPGATGAIGGMHITKSEAEDYSKISFIVGKPTDNGAGAFYAPIELSVHKKWNGEEFFYRPFFDVFGDARFEHETEFFGPVYIQSDIQPTYSGYFNVGTSQRPWKNVYVTGGVIQISDAREKTDIEPSDLGLNFVLRLKPVRYTRQGSAHAENELANSKQRRHYGLIAQDVKAVMDELGVDFGGYKLADPANPESLAGLDYSEFIAPIIRALQELAERVAALEKALASRD